MSNESQSSIEEEFESFCRRYGVHSAGEMAAKISGFDWATTPLGPINSWSETLLSAVNMILSAPLPMQLLWGQDFTLIYNDAFMPFLAGKHPAALGRPAAECWFEAWGIVGPQLEQVRLTGQPVQFESSLVPIARNGMFS